MGRDEGGWRRFAEIYLMLICCERKNVRSLKNTVEVVQTNMANVLAIGAQGITDTILR